MYLNSNDILTVADLVDEIAKVANDEKALVEIFSDPNVCLALVDSFDTTLVTSRISAKITGVAYAFYSSKTCPNVLLFKSYSRVAYCSEAKETQRYSNPLVSSITGAVVTNYTISKMPKEVSSIVENVILRGDTRLIKELENELKDFTETGGTIQ